jgi:hypothetical protein
VTFLALDGLDSNLPIYLGLGGSLIAYIAVSLGGKPPLANLERTPQ